MRTLLKPFIILVISSVAIVGGLSVVPAGQDSMLVAGLRQLGLVQRSSPQMPPQNSPPIDAATLNGHAGLYYLQSANLTGVINPTIFSAYDSLVAERKLPDLATIATQADMDTATADLQQQIDSSSSQIANSLTEIDSLKAGLRLDAPIPNTSLHIVAGTGIIIQNGHISAVLGQNVDLLTEVVGTLAIAHGGTGLNAAPVDGQFVIGKNGGYGFANLVDGSGIELTQTGSNFEIKVDSTVCLITGNCSGVGSGIVGAGVADQLAFFTNAQTIASAAAITWNAGGNTLGIDGDIDVSGNYFVNGQPISTSHVAEGAGLYWTQFRFNTAFSTKSTSDLAEGTGLYWTNARFDARLSSKTTSDLAEGSRLYFTDARVAANPNVTANTAARHAVATIADSATLDLTIVGQHISGSVIQSGIQTSLINNHAGFISTISLAGFDTDNLAEGSAHRYWSQALFDAAFDTKSTTDLAEGSNLYWTQLRFDNALANATTSDLAEGSNTYWTQARFNTAFGNKTTDDLAQGSANRYSQWATESDGLSFVGGNVGIGTTDTTFPLTINGPIGTVAEGDVFRQYDGNSEVAYPIFARYWDGHTTYGSGTFIFGNGPDAYVSMEKPGGSNLELFRVMANNSTFSGAITIAGTTTLSGLSTNGGLLYTNGSGAISQLAAGTVGQCLKSTGGVPAWGACAAGDSITGSGTTGQLAFFNSGSTLTGDSGLTWDPDTDTLTVAGTIAMDGSIIPTTDIAYDLGSPSFQWKDVYIGPGSLYINGQKVLEDSGESIVVTADPAQNLALRTTSGGDIEFNAQGGGVIQLKSNVQLTGGNSISTSDLTAVLLPTGLRAGNIEITGNGITTTNLNGDLAFTPNGAGDSYFTSGNVGVGNTDPNHRLDVSGDINTSGDFLKDGQAIDTDDILEGALRLYYTNARVSANTDVSANTAARHAAATINDSATLDLTMVGQQISGSVIQSGLQTSLMNNDAGFVTNLSAFSTTNLAEGTNLYYTQSRFNSAFAAKSTDNLAEGSTNLYSQWTNTATGIAFGDDVALGGTTASNSTFYFDAANANLALGASESIDGALVFHSSGVGITSPSISTNSAGDLVLSAPSGQITVGDGAGGDINLYLVTESDSINFDKTATLTGALTSNDYIFTRNLTGGANNIGGAIVMIQDKSATTATNNPDMLLINAAPISGTFTGNLLRLQVGGSNKFLVDSYGKATVGDNLELKTVAGSSVYVGFEAGLSSAQVQNTALGYLAYRLPSSGINNIAIGHHSMTNAQSGSDNVAVGAGALIKNREDHNIAIGSNALSGNLLGDGNIGLGTFANYRNENGNYNVVIGYRAGMGTTAHSKSGNIFIGHEAGYNEHGSNLLYIENSNSSTPLIYGNFATDALTFNGSVTITNGLTVSGGPLSLAADSITDAMVSNTLTASLFAGTGSTSNSVDLGTSEVAGVLSILNGGTSATTAQVAINNISGLTTAGDLLAHDGTNAIRLARGSAGQCLTSTEAGIEWGNCGESLPADNVTGSGAAGRIAYWSGTNTQTSSSSLAWTSASNTLTLSSSSTYNGRVGIIYDIYNSTTMGRNGLSLATKMGNAFEVGLISGAGYGMRELFDGGSGGYGERLILGGWSGASRFETADGATGYKLSRSATINRAEILSSAGIQLSAINDVTIAGTSDLLITGGDLTISSLTANGGLLYTNASGTVAQLGVGTAGQCLVSTAGVPSWGNCGESLPADNVTGSGAAGRVAFWNGTNTQTSSSNLVWDNTNRKLTLGPSSWVGGQKSSLALKGGNTYAGAEISGDKLTFHAGASDGGVLEWAGEGAVLKYTAGGPCYSTLRLDQAYNSALSYCTGSGTAYASFRSNSDVVSRAELYSDAGIQLSAANNVTIAGTSDLNIVGGGLSVAGDIAFGGSITGSGASLTALNAGSISSGLLTIANGGTGATTAQAAINNISGLTTGGDLLTHNGTNAIRLAKGSAGQCLTSTNIGLEWGDCGKEIGAEWISRASAASLNWLSITYGDGQFVSVSTSVMTSPDGATWTTRTPATANSWTSVVYGNGIYVAVSTSGTGDRVMTSNDGITWTSQTSAADNSWQSVTYGNGVFVAVSSDGANRVMTSPDGVTWTAQSASQANSWQSVTYGNGVFVAVSSDGANRVMTSPDGVTWTAQSASAAYSWLGTTYGNGLFVAVSSNGVMTSPNGTTWTNRTVPGTRNWRSVAYGSGKYIAVADAAGVERVMTSIDAINWAYATSPQLNLRSIAYGNGVFAAVAWGGSGNFVLTSGQPIAAGNPNNNIYQGGMTINGGLISNNGLKIGNIGALMTAILSDTAVWDPVSLAAGEGTSTTLSVANAAMGDVVSVGFDQALPDGVIISGSVSTAGTVKVTIFNGSTGVVDLPSGTVRVKVTQF